MGYCASSAPSWNTAPCLCDGEGSLEKLAWKRGRRRAAPGGDYCMVAVEISGKSKGAGAVPAKTQKCQRQGCVLIATPLHYSLAPGPRFTVAGPDHPLLLHPLASDSMRLRSLCSSRGQSPSRHKEHVSCLRAAGRSSKPVLRLVQQRQAVVPLVETMSTARLHDHLKHVCRERR